MIAVDTREIVEPARVTPNAGDLSLADLDVSLAAVLSLVADGIVMTNEQGTITLFNRAAEQLFGFSAEEVLNHPIEILIPARFRDLHKEHVLDFGALTADDGRDMARRRAIVGRAKDGREFPIEVSLARNIVQGRPILAAVIRDISERRRLEMEKSLQATELAHRFKNLMGLVNSIITLTARDTASVPAFQESLRGRLTALARTHDVLLNEARGADLLDLVRSEIGPYRSLRDGNIFLSGPSVLLPPRLATDIALVLHELTTNAAKYGALSRKCGRLSISWHVEATADAERLTLDWVESGGPPVSPPTRCGFGTRLIERSLGGVTCVDYAATGLEAHFAVHLAPPAPAAMAM